MPAANNRLRVRECLAAILLCAITYPGLAGTSLSTLYTFDPVPLGGTTNVDGVAPQAPLVQDAAGNLYGTNTQGGPSGTGTVFQLSPSGTFTVVHAFSARTSAAPVNADGSWPSALIIDASGNLYGTASYGGSGDSGTIFRLSGGVFTTLHSFDATSATTGSNTEGWAPNGLLLSADGNLYGIAAVGGPTGNGTVFRMAPDGSAFSVLYAFSAVAPNGLLTNADGANPAVLVQLPGGDLCGITTNGGPNAMGTVFRLTTAGAFTTLYAFTGKADGRYPTGLLLARDGNLYGTAQTTFFRITPTGAFTTLFTFTPGDGTPTASLVEGADGVFFGTTLLIANYGPANYSSPLSFFSIDALGNLSRLYLFAGNSMAEPINYPSLVASRSDPTGTFYGVLTSGAITQPGGIYTLALTAPSLGAAPAPVFSPAPGVYPVGIVYQTVYISDTAPGVYFYYTTDGSTPTTASTLYQGDGSIQLSASATLRAIAVGGSYGASPVASATYTITASGGSPPPSRSPSGGGFDWWTLILLALLGARSLRQVPRRG